MPTGYTPLTCACTGVKTTKLATATWTTKAKRRHAKCALINVHGLFQMWGKLCGPQACGVLNRSFRTSSSKDTRQRHENKQPDDGNDDNHNEYFGVVEVLATNHKCSGNIALCGR